MANNMFQEQITPDKPKILQQERIFVYVPKATATTQGIASFDDTDFRLNNGKVYFKKNDPRVVPSLIKILADPSQGGLEYTDDNIVKVQIKTMNGQSLLGTGNIVIDLVTPITEHNADLDAHPALRSRISALETIMPTKQDKLVSGQNIKTINNQSILDSGNINVTVDTSDKVDKVSGSSAISNESGTITLYTGHLISGGSNTSISLSNSLTKILSQQIGLANSNKSELSVDTSGIILKSLDNDSSTELKVTKQGATLNNEQIAVQSYVDSEISNLQDEVDTLKSRGRFLSIWNPQTGLPTTNPDSLPYDYNTGDYFIVGAVTPNVTHYQPSGTQYTGSASTTIEAREINSDDVYYFDGTSWSLQINTVDISNKADKVSNATNGNFAALDGNGNLTDSTKKASDFMSSSEKVGKNLSLSGNTLSLKDQDGNTLGNSVTLPTTDISGKEDKSNKVTSLSSASTDTQYPSAKCVYDIVGNIVSLMEEL